MKINAKAFPFPLAYAAYTSAKSFLRFTHTQMNPPVSLPPASERLVLQPTNLSGASSRTVEPPSIYAVDDSPSLTELYTTILEAAGYFVRVFNHRAQALLALKADSRRPSLLITNYFGFSMPVSLFIQACRSVEPNLRILMASGLDQSEMRFSQVKPDRFIQKPFTPEEFQQAVNAALADH